MKRSIIDIETTGLQPVKDDNRVLAIGVDNAIIMHPNEKQSLTEFWEYLSTYTQLCGFNIDGFDIRFLLIRSVKHRVPVKRFTTLDLRRILANNQYKAEGTLTDYCRIFGIEDGDELTGAEMIDAGQRWLAGDDASGALICSHLGWDLRKTKELHDLLVEIGLVTKLKNETINKMPTRKPGAASH